MVSDDLRAAAQQELMRRQAQAELDRRAASAQSQPDATQPSNGRTDTDIARLITGDNDPAAQAQAQRDQYYSSGIYSGAYNPLGPIAKSIDAFASGAQRAPLMGWDDEAVAAARSLAGSTPYSVAQQQEDAKKQAMRVENPVASTLGELSGGLAAGGTAAAAGATLAGRSLPVVGRAGAAALEGAGYGALTGAGEAKPGDRLLGAEIGAGLGAATGGIMGYAGDKLASRYAAKAASEAAPAVDDLASAANGLYDQARQAGVVIKPQAAGNMIDTMTLAAGRINQNLKPKTAGVVDDILAMKGQPMDLQQFDELRQTIGMAMKNAEPQDVRTLQLMKNQMDAFADRVSPSDVTGNLQGFDVLKQARDLWARKSKTQALENIFDLADVDSSRYSQSGQANAIRLKAQQLYKQIVNGKQKGFTDEETALVRKLAKNELTPTVVNWAAKFAPRGVVSSAAGSALGAALGGMAGAPVLGAAIPGAIGYGAAKVADNAALQGFNALRNAAASGKAPILQAISNKTVPLIGGLSSELSSQVLRGR